MNDLCRGCRCVSCRNRETHGCIFYPDLPCKTCIRGASKQSIRVMGCKGVEPLEVKGVEAKCSTEPCGVT